MLPVKKETGEKDHIRLQSGAVSWTLPEKVPLHPDPHSPFHGTAQEVAPVTAPAAGTAQPFPKYLSHSVLNHTPDT